MVRILGPFCALFFLSCQAATNLRSLTGANENQITTPYFTGTDPASGSGNPAPKIQGTCDSNTSIHVYTTADCSGSPLSTDSCSTFETSGVAVSVATGTTTTLYANASYGLSYSGCTSTGISYLETTSPDVTQPTVTSWFSYATHGALGDISIEIAADGSTVESRDIRDNAKIAIQFSEAMDTLSLSDTSISFKGNDNVGSDPLNGHTLNSGDFTWTSGDTVVFINFSTFNSFARYCFKLTDDVTDVAGNQLSLNGDEGRTMLFYGGDVNADLFSDILDFGTISSLNGTDPIDTGNANHVRSDLNLDGAITIDDRNLLTAMPGWFGAAAMAVPACP